MESKNLAVTSALIEFDEFGMVEIRDPALLETVSAGLFNASGYVETNMNGNNCGNDNNFQTNGGCAGNLNGACLVGVNGVCGTNNNCYEGRGGTTPNSEVWFSAGYGDQIL